MKRFALLFLFAVLQSARAATPVELTPAASLDLQRFMGTWYELGKIPGSFPKQCEGDTSATYAAQDNGRVKVTFNCRIGDKTDEATGELRLRGEPGSARLEGRFTARWLKLVPFMWSDFWVIEVTPDYQLAAVGDPARESLSILSRTPQVSADTYARMLLRLAVKGYDLRRIEPTTQSAR